MTIARPLSDLGSPPRVVIRKVVRTQYRLEWEWDGWVGDYDDETGARDYEPARKRKVRHVNTAATAYRMAAMRLIFAKRDTLATGFDGRPTGCSLCDVAPHGPEDPPLCRYHGGDGFEQLRSRLARWLRWADSRGMRGAP